MDCTVNILYELMISTATVTPMYRYLLEEGNELTSPPLVWLGQVDILEVENESL